MQKTKPNNHFVFQTELFFWGKICLEWCLGVGFLFKKCFIFTVCGKMMVEIFGSFQHRKKLKNLHRGEVRVEQREHSKHSCELYHQNRLKTLHKNVWKIH